MVLLAAVLCLAPAARFRGVVQIYREGIEIVDGSGNESRGPFGGFSREAALTPGPGRSFAIYDKGRVFAFEGLKQVSNVRVGDRAEVIGWSGRWPIVSSGGKVFLASGRSKLKVPGAPGCATR